MNESTMAKALEQDPRVAEAKKLLLQAVQDHQKGLEGIKPPNPSLKKGYEELLKAFAECRGNKLWFPYISSGIGKGALVELMDGSVKYDMISGIGPHYFGHSHPEMIEAAFDAALSDTIMQGHLQQNYDSLELSQLLIEISGLPHCFLTSSGVMANENALKIAFQKNHPANRILAFEHCFVGRTLAASQITDKPSFREGLPSNLFVDYIPFYDPARPEESTKEALTALQKLLERYPKQYAIMIFEMVQGEGGFHAGSADYFQTLAKEGKKGGAAIFADEVQTFGRTPAPFAFQYFGLEKYVDIASIGKLSQVCATLFTKEYAPKAGLLSQTFTGSTSAIRAGKVMIQDLVDRGYYGPQGKIVKIHQSFVEKFEKIKSRHPEWIHGPWGLGAMIAFTPFDGNPERATAFVKELFNEGVMGFIAGARPTRVRFLIPAAAIQEKDIAEVASIIEKTLARMAT